MTKCKNKTTVNYIKNDSIQIFKDHILISEKMYNYVDKAYSAYYVEKRDRYFEEKPDFANSHYSEKFGVKIECLDDLKVLARNRILELLTDILVLCKENSFIPNKISICSLHCSSEQQFFVENKNGGGKIAGVWGWSDIIEETPSIKIGKIKLKYEHQQETFLNSYRDWVTKPKEHSLILGKVKLVEVIE